ncbi:hypothetical protein [Psychrobacter pygoscelis]|uniref:hypothetical protein n=1 Tax=Psychrobacter pygoscelis TaxID=2488563 RepID=UPI00103BA3B2|nr:hypothetical protein [Psychrobacter pygoscelis]
MATTVEFYKVSFFKEEQGNSMTLEDYFASIVSKSLGFRDEFDRDIYDFKKINNMYYGGVFRKIRTDEIIETGKVGSEGRRIQYPQGEGKLETNHLVFFPQYDVIGYVRNVHANHFKRLEKCLSEAFKRKVLLSPLITKGSLRNILHNKVVLKMDVSVPVSASDISNDGALWSDEAMRAVAKSGVDILKLQANVDLRSTKHGKIKNAYENIKNLLSKGATRAVVQVEDIDGKLDKIDLIADRIVFEDDSYSYAKEAKKSDFFYDKIVDAYLGKLDEIERVC